MFVGAHMKFLTKSGDEKVGTLVRSYPAFEGGMRYILDVDGIQYRCVWQKQDDKEILVEYVA